MKSYIHDPIHGHIFLTEVERWIIDNLEFQRLRFIRQNSLLHYVFPGAFHTRFAHSLGACHISGRISRQLINWVNEPEIYYPIQVYRLACLLHDVGHGAFSHALDYIKVNNKPFMPTLFDVFEEKMNWGFDDIEFLENYFSEKVKNFKDTPISHEDLSLIVINKIFQHIPEKYLDDYEKSELIQDICSLIEPSIKPTVKYKNSAMELYADAVVGLPRLDSLTKDDVSPESFHSVFSSLVSGTLDADRMDYLLRDSQAFGVNYGLFDLEGILSSLSLVVKGDKFYLGLNSKRINTFDDFLWSRYQMFKQIYCHKTHVGYNLLLNDSIEELIKNEKLAPPQSLKDFLFLTDDYIMGMVFHQAQNRPDEDGAAQKFAKRQLPQYLGVYEASLVDDIWNLSADEIYKKKKSSFKGDDEFDLEKIKIRYMFMKAEVIKGKNIKIPLAYSLNKKSKVYEEKEYFSRSVFFDQPLKKDNQEMALINRLNRRLIYFFN